MVDLTGRARRDSAPMVNVTINTPVMRYGDAAKHAIGS